jgi:hypothetical protein
MIEIMVDGARPPIPAVMRLRARYRGNRAAYAADKMRRNRQVGLFSRPTWGDRMDNGNAKNHYRKLGPFGTKLEKVAYTQHEREARSWMHKHDQTRPYRGSKAEAENRGRGFWGGKK